MQRGFKKTLRHLEERQGPPKQHESFVAQEHVRGYMRLGHAVRNNWSNGRHRRSCKNSQEARLSKPPAAAPIFQFPPTPHTVQPTHPEVRSTTPLNAEVDDCSRPVSRAELEGDEVTEELADCDLVKSKISAVVNNKAKSVGDVRKHLDKVWNEIQPLLQAPNQKAKVVMSYLWTEARKNDPDGKHHTDHSTLWIPFLRRIPPTLKGAKVHLSSLAHAILESFVNKYIGPEPGRIDYSGQGPVHYKCKPCRRSNGFLASKDRIWHFQAVKKDRQHIEEKVSSGFGLSFETIQNLGFAWTLVLTKKKNSAEKLRAAWNERFKA
ncbi:hypothetical protein V8F06_003399, partial [Rhypophila decipiens]